MKRTERRPVKYILLFCVAFCLISFTALESESGPQTARKEKNMSASQEIMAVLSCRGYGYKVKVLVNGTDVGITGGKSESRRLFDKDNEMAAMAAPEIRKKNFVLLNGPNTVAVEFAKESSNQDDRVEITLEMQNYPAPLFKLVSKKPSGKAEKTIIVQNGAPAGFETVMVSD